MKYNPFSDRPVTEILYPEVLQGESVTLSGAMRISGSAADNESVSKVYIQIDVNNDGKFTDDDKTYLSANSYVIKYFILGNRSKRNFKLVHHDKFRRRTSD